MAERFAFKCDWLNRRGDELFDRAFAVGITISLDNQPLTRLFCELEHEIRDDMRVCAWQLAQWFAANWWRLRWESDAIQSRRNEADWGMSHNMASAGGGFVWPAIVFDSDGESIGISHAPNRNPPPYEPARYLNEIHASIPAAEFERSVDEFLSTVVARGAAVKGVDDRELGALWNEVLEERRDPEASRYRKWEAIAGYDPDEAPETVIDWIVKASDYCGQQASEEIAAQAQHDSVEVFEAIQGMSKRPGIIVSMPSLAVKPKPAGTGEQPWQKAERFARSARREWGLGNGPVSGKQLAELVEASGDKLFGGHVTQLPLSFIRRNEKGNRAHLFLTRKPVTSRRFAVCRLIGDSLYGDGQDRLLPATDADTARQKFQRAFAAEFLCPYDALQDKLGAKALDDDDVEDAADYFNVSPLLVDTVLRNKGMLGRGMLNQQVG